MDNEAFFNHDMIKALIVSFIAGIVFCFITTGHYVIALFCFGLIFFAVFCCYCKRVNLRNVIKLLLLNLLCISGYFFVCYNVDFKGINYYENELRFVYGGTIVFILILIAIFLSIKKDVAPQNEKLEELFVERKGDLKRIEEFVEEFSMVCIDAPWGQGKSFLMDHFREKNKNKYIFIRIKPLTYGVEKIAQYVVNELFSVLEQNEILSFKFFVKNALATKNEHIGLLTSIFTDSNDTTYDFLQQVCLEVEKLDKKVVIYFEDIDRITKFEIVADIFSVSETISELTEKIKIVFECDKEKISEIVNEYRKKCCANYLKDDYASNYLEKYLSHSIHLSNIGLGKAMINFFDLRKGDENNG